MATIQGVYVALFGRPADPTGLAYFNSVTKNGADLRGIGDLASTQEYKDRFAGQNNIQIINSVYQSLFGRDADVTGLNFFSDALNKGTLNINNIAIAILDGAQGNDKTIVDNKVAAANLYTSALDTGSEIVAYAGNNAAASGRAFLSTVSTTVPTQATVDAAVKTMVDTNANGGGTPGQIYTLVAGTADSFNPTSAVAANKTTANDDTFRAIAANSLETSDVIDGGAGTDTLLASLTLADATGNDAPVTATIQPVITNVEKLFLDVDLTSVADLGGGAGTDGANYTFNAADVKGAKEIWSSGSSITNGAGASSSITFSNIALGTTVGIKDSAAAVTFGFANTSGASDAATLALSKAAAGAGATIAGIENLTIASADGANNVAVSAADATSVTLTGNQALTVSLTGANVATIDGSALTAASTVTFTPGAVALTAKGGAGADTFSFGNAQSKVTVDLGAGSDTISISSGKAHAITLGAGNDTVNIDATTATNLTADAITTAAKLEAAAVTITDFAAGDKLNVDAIGTTVKTLTGTQLSEVAGQSNLLTALNKAIELGAVGASQNVVFQYGSNTYVYSNDADVALDAGDNLVKLAGLVDLNTTNLTIS